MFRKLAVFFLGFFLYMPLASQAAQFQHPWDRPVGFIRTSGYTSAPQGFLDFCSRHPDDCVPAAYKGPRVDLTLDRMRELNTVNADVNDSLFFNSDFNRDNWDYPDAGGYGDCEDFVIEKRKRLIELGWPSEALLITIVRQHIPDFADRRIHAVLTARTAQGDYILDNEIRPAVSWDRAAELYDYVMMQSERDPRLWALVDSSSRLH